MKSWVKKSYYQNSKYPFEWPGWPFNIWKKELELWKFKGFFRKGGLIIGLLEVLPLGGGKVF